jgi:phosphate-selective porin
MRIVSCRCRADQVRAERIRATRPHRIDLLRKAAALELTARCAYLDFLDSDTPIGPAGQIVGVQMPQTTLGVNWYLTDQLRILVNYSLSAPDEPNAGRSTAATVASRPVVFW